jgi:hypothetical protein
MKDNRNEYIDKYDGRKAINKIKRIKDRREINRNIKNISEIEGDDIEFQSKEKFRK